jgi:amino acid permease
VQSYLQIFSCLFLDFVSLLCLLLYIKVITKLPNSEQSYKGKVKTHNYINRQNQSTTGKL